MEIILYRILMLSVSIQKLYIEAGVCNILALS